VHNQLIKYVDEAFNANNAKKSVLLIDFQHSPDFADDNSYVFYSKSNASNYALGIARVFEYLQKFNVPVTIVRYLDYKQNIAALLSLINRADIIGINPLTWAIKDVFELCVKIKKTFPDKIIVGGAEHFALDYRWILNNQKKTGCDICCTMQGELPLLALALGVPTAKIGSVAYIENDVVIKNLYYPKLNDAFENVLLKV
jgi:hypothetical protein